jgi:hypothetical protein
MRKVKFGATLAFACLGATSASATSLRINDGHAAADFGVGGWTQNFGAKPFASGAVSVVSNAANDAVDFHSDPVRLDLTSSGHRALWLRADADCVFASSTTSAGSRWRPACK